MFDFTIDRENQISLDLGQSIWETGIKSIKLDPKIDAKIITNPGYQKCKN